MFSAADDSSLREKFSDTIYMDDNFILETEGIVVQQTECYTKINYSLFNACNLFLHYKQLFPPISMVCQRDGVKTYFVEFPV